MPTVTQVTREFFKMTIMDAAERQGHKLSDFSVASMGETFCKCIQCDTPVVVRISESPDTGIQVQATGAVFDVACAGIKHHIA